MICTASAWDILADVAELALPPERLTVPEAAERYVILDIKGGYYGPWYNAKTPLLVEPAECLTSRDYDAVIVAAPVQTGKTAALVDNWAFHAICCDPVDFLLVEKSENESRIHSKTKVDRTIQASADIRAKLTSGHGNNVHEKRTRSGAYIWIKWPTKNTLSGATVSRIALTDYDRMPDDIDGEGPAFDLAYSRRTYFGSLGMVLAESSPSKPILDPSWTPATQHEAPPTIGILGLFNTGDRRRVYSRCPCCGEWFSPEASPDAVHVPDGLDEHEQARCASLICTANGCLIGQEHETTFKRDGRWVRDGQTIDADGTLADDGRRSRRASFWMPGWFAAFATWESIIAEYLMARRQFERTGDEEGLKSAINTKIGGPYWSEAAKAAARARTTLDTRKRSIWQRFHMPNGARLLTAYVDVQKRSFEVGVIARGPENERWIMERFSLRETVDGDDIRPAVHLEHWAEITRHVVNATYRLGAGQELRVHKVGIDMGGEPGASQRAYSYWRSLPQDLRRRVLLVKGVKQKQLVRLSWPDSRGRKDRPTGGTGNVPVLEINSNAAKDVVVADLQREVPGRNYIHLPEWLSAAHINELQAETRNEKGEWKQIGRRRNELWDHLYYEHGMWNHLSRNDKANWYSPQDWALWIAPWDRNPEVVSADQRREHLQPKSRRRARFKFR